MIIIRPQHHQQGLSLIELMVAMTLSLVLTLGVIQIFSSSKQTNRVQTSLGNLQADARFAMDLLSYDLRMAGNIGCNRAATVIHVNAADNLPDIGNGIQGYEHAGLPAMLLTVSGKNPNSATIVDNTDSIIVRYASPNTQEITSITTDAATTVTTIVLSSKSKISNGDPVIISDCQNADIFIADEVTSNKKNIALAAEESFSKTYGSDAEVAPLKYVAYYIRQGSNNTNNLYRSVVNGVSGSLDINSSEPLLEGVDDMQILYGEEFLASGVKKIRYVDAGTAGLDMNRVTSIRLSLLFSTIDNGLANSDQSYWLNGTLNTVTSANNSNKKLLRSFTTTVKLRNQGVGL